MGVVQKVWHYLKCAIIQKKELTYHEKKKFRYFGDNSIINKPVTLLSGIEEISIGDNTIILHSSRLQTYGQKTKDRGKVIIGRDCYIGFRFTVLSGNGGMVKIGDHVLIASDVLITNEDHGIDPESSTPYMDQSLIVKNTIIEDGCWLGEKACILCGVTIGTKSIIGAGSVVTHNIPPYSIAAGAPARVIKTYDFERHCWVKNG